MEISRVFGVAVLLITLQTNLAELKLEDSFGIFDEDDRIVGGVETLEGEFPYIVSIQIARNLKTRKVAYRHACGGSILSPDWIITAGHCSTFNQFRYRIVAGAYDLLHPTGNEQVRRVERIITNPQYNPKTVDYDIALLQVSPPFQFTERVKAVRIPSRPFTPKGNGETAGWGLLHKDDKDTPAILQKIQLPIISTPECREIYDRMNLTITDRMICAGIQEGKSVCNGDSGGPLLSSFDGESGDWVLSGLVSWGIPCAVQGFPGVFTNVSALLDFIQKYVNA